LVLFGDPIIRALTSKQQERSSDLSSIRALPITFPLEPIRRANHSFTDITSPQSTSMTITNRETAPETQVKVQPWKAHWPPRTPVQKGEAHGFKKGETLQLEGSAGAHPKQLDKQN
jgi:hypothetical protein